MCILSIVMRVTCWRRWKIASMTADKANVFHFNLGTWTKFHSTSFKRQLIKTKEGIQKSLNTVSENTLTKINKYYFNSKIDLFHFLWPHLKMDFTVGIRSLKVFKFWKQPANVSKFDLQFYSVCDSALIKTNISK